MSYLYVINMKSEEEDFIKIGVFSASDIDALWYVRLNRFENYSVELIAAIPFDSIEEAEKFERWIHSVKRTSSDLNYSPRKKFGGGEGECLKVGLFEKIFTNDEIIYKACKERINQIMYSDAFIFYRPENIVEHYGKELDFFIFQDLYHVAFDRLLAYFRR